MSSSPRTWLGQPRSTVVLTFVLVAFVWLFVRDRAELTRLRREDPAVRWQFVREGYKGYWKGTDLLAVDYLDRNHDGVPEHTSLFNRKGQRTSSTQDSDQNGIQERIEIFASHGRVVATYFDHDQDGFAEEWVQNYPDGAMAQWLDEDRDGVYEVRQVRDPKGRPVLTEVDSGVGGFVRK